MGELQQVSNGLPNTFFALFMTIFHKIFKTIFHYAKI